MSAMCRKCLKTASDESRRCASCGGRIVRFSDTGEVIEVDAAGDEPTVRAVACRRSSRISRPVRARPFPMTNATGAAIGPGPSQAPSMHSPCPEPRSRAARSAAPSHSLLRTATASPVCRRAARIPAQVNAHAGPANAGVLRADRQRQSHQAPPTTSKITVSRPAPHGLSRTAVAGASSPSRAEPAGAFLLPATQIDDVVAEMLLPFGFERPAPKPSRLRLRHPFSSSRSTSSANLKTLPSRGLPNHRSYPSSSGSHCQQSSAAGHRDPVVAPARSSDPQYLRLSFAPQCQPSVPCAQVRRPSVPSQQVLAPRSQNRRRSHPNFQCPAPT